VGKYKQWAAELQQDKHYYGSNGMFNFHGLNLELEGSQQDCTTMGQEFFNISESRLNQSCLFFILSKDGIVLLRSNRMSYNPKTCYKKSCSVRTSINGRALALNANCGGL